MHDLAHTYQVVTTPAKQPALSLVSASRSNSQRSSQYEGKRREGPLRRKTNPTIPQAFILQRGAYHDRTNQLAQHVNMGKNATTSPHRSNERTSNMYVGITHRIMPKRRPWNNSPAKNTPGANRYRPKGRKIHSTRQLR